MRNNAEPSGLIIMRSIAYVLNLPQYNCYFHLPDYVPDVVSVMWHLFGSALCLVHYLMSFLFSLLGGRGMSEKKKRMKIHVTYVDENKIEMEQEAFY